MIDDAIRRDRKDNYLLKYSPNLVKSLLLINYEPFRTRI